MPNLTSLLAPESILTTVAERVADFLSVQDFLHYISSSAKSTTSKPGGDSREGPEQEEIDGRTWSHPEEIPLRRLYESSAKEESTYTYLSDSGDADEGAGPRPPPPLEAGEDNLLRMLLNFGLQPWAALGLLRGGLSFVLNRISLLHLLHWTSGQAKGALRRIFCVALLPINVSLGAVAYVIGTVEVMLSVASEVWCELRHLGLGDLLCVITCLLKGESLPSRLLEPLGVGDSGESSRATGSRSSSGSSSAPWNRRSSAQSQARSGNSACLSDSHADSRAWAMGGMGNGNGSGGRGTWRHAHTLRRRLDRVNRTASLVAYEEKAERAVPRVAAQRVRRRMHYDIPLRCFEATVTVDRQSPTSSDIDEGEGVEEEDHEGTASAGRFMCTPQSFPPTPISRAHVMTRYSQFSDDILFLARDHLRLDQHTTCEDETTRLTADFLRRQERLAVLNNHDAADGIRLTCGQHCATKVGSTLYSSIRAMVPVLRNRYVFFQISVMVQELLPSLSIGLSTPEMPLSTLVGAFSNSVGLCSTGQILMSTRWFGNPGDNCYGSGSTVGVLVYLDGSNPIRSWDGDMVRALVTFTVDGQSVKIPPHKPAAVVPTSLNMAIQVPYGRAPWEAAAAAAAEASGGSGGLGGGGVSAGGGSGVGGEETGGEGGSGTISGTELGLGLPKDRDLFPTITLHSPGTQVFCRFCAADMLYCTREGVGAPPRVPIYALDGSLILDAEAPVLNEV